MRLSMDSGEIQFYDKQGGGATIAKVDAGGLIVSSGKTFQLGGAFNSTGDTATNGYLEVYDNTGTLRKIATVA